MGSVCFWAIARAVELSTRFAAMDSSQSAPTCALANLEVHSVSMGIATMDLLPQSTATCALAILEVHAVSMGLVALALPQGNEICALAILADHVVSMGIVTITLGHG